VSEQLAELVDLLDLEQVEENLFRGYHPRERTRRLYGGQIMAQALMGAARTVPADRIVHSLHGYFLRPGTPKVPAVIKVERLRDGGSFSSRRVVVLQNGEAIFNMDASFHIVEEGMTHQFSTAESATADPSGLPPSKPPSAEQIPAYLYDDTFITWRHEFRRLQSTTPQAPQQYVWFKPNGTVPDDPILHTCLLVYQSDNTLLGTSRLAHRGKFERDEMQVASLDHAMWFHKPVNVASWLLYAQDSPSAAASRGLTRGLIYDEAGELIASTVQEGLIRLHS